ncbi:MAG TPA: mucoidy inhibitor MuiA family protein [Acidobacteriota bacterium]|mgnify:CR=1 FL=1|nr:mucoidy inhibitor MuiA family protein [Acidobacteriota bacterium]
MKKYLFFSTLAIFSLAAWCEGITAKSRINSVEIFSDRAVVERTATVELQSGTHVVTFEGLPPSIIDSTIRVSGKGTASVEIMGTEVEEQDIDNPRMKELDQKIEAMEIEKKRVEGSLALLGQQEELLNSIMANSTTQTGKEIAAGKPDIISLDKFFAFITAKFETIKTSRFQLELKQAELSKERDSINKEYATLLSNKARKGKKIAVLMKCDRPGNLTLLLYYTVKGCSWAPAYIAKTLPESSQIEITTMASISQRTYEDWQEAAVTLSTAAPAMGATPPELNPSFIDFYLPQQAKGALKSSYSGNELKGQPGNSGSIVGVVYDDDGEAIPGAAVIVSSAQGNGSKGTSTDVGGNFKLDTLPPADDYKITVEAPGYGKVVQSGISVKVGKKASTMITMISAGEEMVVTGRAPYDDEEYLYNGLNISDADYSNASLSEAGIHVNFSIKGRIDVPSDGKPHKYYISKNVLDAKYDYFGVPRQDDKAFMRGVFTNKMDYPILPGEVEFFYAGELVGSAYLPAVARGQEAEAYFGRNSEISLKFEELKREKLEQGFLGNKERIKFQNKITIENHTRSDIRIELLDKLPKPQRPEIELVDVKIVPDKTSEKPNSILSWILDLKPQEKKEILVDFTIEYPKGVILRGI